MAHTSSLLHALDAAEQSTGWNGMTSASSDSVNRANQRSIISTISSKNYRSLSNDLIECATNNTDIVKISSPLRKVIINKQPKPLRGCVTGLLIKDSGEGPISSSETRLHILLPNRLDQQTNKERNSQNSSNVFHVNMSVPAMVDVSIRSSNKTSLNSSAAEKFNSHQPETLSKSLIENLCPRCKTPCNSSKACSHCGLPAAENSKLLQPSEVEPQNVNINKSMLTSARLSPNAFYAHRLQGIFCNTPVIRKSIKSLKPHALKRGTKRPAVEPPECFTLSSDDEGLESKESLESCEEESNKSNHADNDEKNLFNSMNCDKVSECLSKTGTIRPLSPEISPNFKVLDLHIICRSIRIGSFKVTPDAPLTITPEYFCMTIPTVKDSNEMVTIRIGLKDIMGAMVNFGKMLPIIILYTTPGCAGAIRCRLRMSSKSGPYYDCRGADESQKRIIFLPENLSDNERITIKVIFRDFDKHRPNPPEDSTLTEIDQKQANELLVRSTPLKIVDAVNQLITPQCRRGRSLNEGDCTEKLLRRSPVIIPLERQQNKGITTVLVYPPPPQTGGITITTEDVNCLEPGEFINDVIIDFYLKYIHLEKLNEVDRKRTHVFSSFFYKRLTHSGMPSLQSIRSPQEVEDRSLPVPERRHRRVQTWTRHVDIFEKDFIIIPINESSHWFLAIICYPYLTECGQNEISDCRCQDTNSPSLFKSDDNRKVNAVTEDCSLGEPFDPSTQKKGVNETEKKLYTPYPKRPCILLFDSLHSRNLNRVVTALREYLRMEWKAKKGTVRSFERETFKGAYPVVPQQNNYSDCGIYLLQYVESFFENPILDYSLPIRTLQTWFPEHVINNKRNSIKELILKLNHEQNEGDLAKDSHLDLKERLRSQSVAKKLFLRENQTENAEKTTETPTKVVNQNFEDERMEVDENEGDYSRITLSQNTTDSSR